MANQFERLSITIGTATQKLKEFKSVIATSQTSETTYANMAADIEKLVTMIEKMNSASGGTKFSKELNAQLKDATNNVINFMDGLDKLSQGETRILAVARNFDTLKTNIKSVLSEYDKLESAMGKKSTNPNTTIPTGTPGTVLPLPPQAAQQADVYDVSLKNIATDLQKLGVNGEAATRIIGLLETKLRSLPLKSPIDGINASPKNGMLGISSFNSETSLGDAGKIGMTVNPITGYTKQEESQLAKEVSDRAAMETKFIKARDSALAQRERQAKQLEVIAKQEKAAQDLLNMQTAAQADPKLAPAFNQAQQRGFYFTDLKSIEQQGNSGVRLMSFAKDDMSQGYKVVEKFNTTITQTGTVLPEVGRKFRTFGESVLRDVTELTKWSIAMAVIYAPLQKLSEMSALMVSNEVKLASATIAVNNVFTQSKQIFDAASLAANNSGEEVTKTIDAFTQAYRATGGGASATERFTTTQALLADSMTLSKLAGIDEATAIDTLSAALRQTGTALDKGASLLDKWVATSQVANVDIGTLATGFAVMGDTADSAGLSIDELNGLVGTIAETGLASGTAAANMARRVVTMYQTPEAVDSLKQIGVATEDATGKTRSFLDITQQLYEMRLNKKDALGKEIADSAIISNEDFVKLTMKLGQGQRGQASVSALISNFNRYTEITAVSANTQGGEAAKALEQQLGTAQTAINRFNNAFQQFTQTLGTKGGLLSIFTDLTNGGTGFLNILDAITGSMGKSTPIVLAMTAALVAFYKRPADQRLTLGAAMSNNFENMAMNVQGYKDNNTVPDLGSLNTQAEINKQNAQKRAASFSNFMTGGGNAASKATLGAGIGIAVAAIPAMMNLKSGDSQAALADAGGAIAGGIAGMFIGGGPMGAMVGSTIGTSMAEMFLSLTRPEIDLWKVGKTVDTTTPAGGGTSPDSIKNQQRMKEISDQLTKEVGGLTTTLFTDSANSMIDSLNSAKTPEEINKKFDYYKNNTYNGKEFLNQAAGLGITQEAALANLKNGTQFKPVAAGQVPFALSNNNALKTEFTGLSNAEINQGNDPNKPGFITTKLEETRTKFGSMIADIITKSITEMSQQRVQGKINASTYATQTDTVSNFKTAGLPVIAALQDSMNPEKLKELMDIFSYGTPEASQNIVTLANNLLNLQQQLAATTDEAEKAKLKEAIAGMTGGLNADVTAAGLVVQTQRSPQTPIQGSVSQPYGNKGEVSSITNIARDLQRQYYKSAAGGGLSDALITQLESTFEKAAFPIKDAAGLFYEIIAGLDPKFLAEAIKMAGDQGLTPSQQPAKSVDFQQYKDVDRATLEKLAAQSIGMNQQWKSKFGYTGTVDQQIAIAKNGVASPLKADFKILSMLLEKLVDQGQKQLDGMYNLPDGASFWVNLAAAKMDRETRAASGAAGAFTTGAGDYLGTPVTTSPKIIEPPQAHNYRPETGTGINSKAPETPPIPSYMNPWGLGATPPVTPVVSDTGAQGIINAIQKLTLPFAGGMGVPPVDLGTAIRGLIDNLKALFPVSGGRMGAGDTSPNPIQGVDGGIFGSLPGMLKDAISGITLPAQQVTSNIVQSLNMRATSTTYLYLDGALLASVIKPYLLADLQRATTTSNTTATFVYV